MTEWQSIISTGSIQNSYGSFVRSGRKPPEPQFQHFVEPEDTLAGISLKYSVTTEDLRRINKLHYTDSIQSRQFLFVPVTKDSKSTTTIDQEVKSKGQSPQKTFKGTLKGPEEGEEDAEKGEKLKEADTSVQDFLQKLDMQISSTKKIASTMLTEKSYELPIQARVPTTKYMRKTALETDTTFSNSKCYHNTADEFFRL